MRKKCTEHQHVWKSPKIEFLSYHKQSLCTLTEHIEESKRGKIIHKQVAIHTIRLHVNVYLICKEIVSMWEHTHSNRHLVITSSGWQPHVHNIHVI